MNYFEAFETIQKSATLKDPSGLHRRFYDSPHLALFDVATSLQQFLSHKPKIAIIRSGSSVVETLIPQFLKNQTPIQFKTNQQNTFEFLETIDKETCFVLWASENEVTGESLYSQKDIEEIHNRLSQKRIFSVQLDLVNFDLNSAPQKWPYSIVVQAPNLFVPLAEMTGAVKFGDKFKAPSLIGNFQFQADQKQIFHSKSVMQQRFFTSLNGVSGSLIKSSLGWSDVQAFAAADLPTWITETWKSWWPEAESPNFLRGLIVVNLNQVLLKADADGARLNEISELVLSQAERLKNSMTWRSS